MDADEHLCPTRFWWVNLQCFGADNVWFKNTTTAKKRGVIKMSLKGKIVIKCPF